MCCQASEGGQPGRRLISSKAQGRCEQPVLASILPDRANDFLASHNFHLEQFDSSWGLPKVVGLLEGAEALPESSKVLSAHEEMAATGEKS